MSERGPWPPPELTIEPHYWQWETSGVLRPAVERFIKHEPLSEQDIATMRAYLRQWVSATAWDANPHASDEDRQHLAELRARVHGLTSRKALDDFINDLIEEGLDPL